MTDENFDDIDFDDDNNNELQFAENIEITEEDFNPLDSYEEKRKLLEKTKILKQTWSILEIYQKINKKNLILSPAYQRNSIWSVDKQTAFIESIFMDLLIPPIYVVEIPGTNMLEDSSYEVVDGKQRLTAIFRFITNGYKLKKRALEYFTDLYGDKNYTEIEIDFSSEIKSLLSSVLDIYVITANSPEFTKYDIFSRLNKGSEKLRVNEIRKAIYRSNTLAKIEEFVDAYIENKIPEYFKMFSKTDIHRFEDFGRFYRSIAFYINSRLGDVDEDIFVENYNSRPRDMINSVLQGIQNKSILLDQEQLNKILSFTLELGVWLIDNKTVKSQIDHIIDICVPFIDKINGDFELIKAIMTNEDFLNTFEKSPSTTTNVNSRLKIASRHFNA
ncbi:hypothetical protein L1276_002578 [Flavobacterium sp. HSC-32F16]|uniref:DUF262 domain-containing protein n=1 Tax=Flavobacterium sp. HSC-32F16 TaxID=2910964 RepID=UPI0020A3A99F|nr:DUF262 domain-containing protein [Flavobacterium sp. HSC-32F16]MCP2027421.1 hypothetical protein [Flavobacterium sp. HSC-32F16]